MLSNYQTKLVALQAELTSLQQALAAAQALSAKLQTDLDNSKSSLDKTSKDLVSSQALNQKLLDILKELGVDVKDIDKTVKQVKEEMVLQWWKGAKTGTIVGVAAGIVVAVAVEELIVHKK